MAILILTSLGRRGVRKVYESLLVTHIVLEGLPLDTGYTWDTSVLFLDLGDVSG